VTGTIFRLPSLQFSWTEQLGVSLRRKCDEMGLFSEICTLIFRSGPVCWDGYSMCPFKR